jgi:hypothetical protein
MPQRLGVREKEGILSKQGIASMDKRPARERYPQGLSRSVADTMEKAARLAPMMSKEGGCWIGKSPTLQLPSAGNGNNVPDLNQTKTEFKLFISRWLNELIGEPLIFNIFGETYIFNRAPFMRRRVLCEMRYRNLAPNPVSEQRGRYSCHSETEQRERHPAR